MLKPFPMPYEDNFEQTPLEHTPRYLSDQDGAFEVHPCDGRAGKCLEQVITIKPIPWGPLPDPFTLAGDSAWTDYTVAADAHFLSTSPVVLMGRIDSANVFEDGNARWPSGYVFSVGPNGSWKLFSTEFKKPVAMLGSGSIELDRTRWHHLELRFRGKHVEAYIDGKSVASAEDSTHAHGMFGIGSEWDHAQFDNLAVTAN
jgi:hypothetical protein